MLPKRRLLLLASTLLLHAGEAHDEIITCTPTLIYQCTMEGCQKIPLVTIEGSQHFDIDPAGKRLVGKIGESQVDIDNIVSSHGDNEAFVFFGLKKNTATHWVVRIGKRSGDMVIDAINGIGNSYTIFGSCSWKRGV